MTDQVVNLESVQSNLSPVGFRMVAEDLLKCYEQFKPDRFSLVPFLLCSLAIELALKAIHLEMTPGQQWVKDAFGHDLTRAYDALPANRRILSVEERALLVRVCVLHMGKNFQYLQPIDAVTGYGQFPDLNALASLAQKMVNAIE